MEVALSTGVSDLIVNPQFVPIETSTQLLQRMNELPLIRHPQFMLFGTMRPMQRSVGFFSNESKGYKYSGQMMAAQPLTRQLTMVMDLVSTICGIRFNAVLVNRYEGKDDYISPHSDDERSLAPGGVVAAISLGESRIFRL